VLLFLKRKANARVSFYESSIEVRESQEYLDVSQIDFVQAQVSEVRPLDAFGTAVPQLA